MPQAVEKVVKLKRKRKVPQQTDLARRRRQPTLAEMWQRWVRRLDKELVERFKAMRLFRRRVQRRSARRQQRQAVTGP